MLRLNSSSLWVFFKKIDNDKREAKCYSCGEVYSFKTSTTNLKTHLKRKHFQAFTFVSNAQSTARTQEQSLAQEPRVKMSRLNSSSLWEFFQKINDEEKEAKCYSCGEVYSFKSSTSNLKAHLKRKHFQAFTFVSNAQSTAITVRTPEQSREQESREVQTQLSSCSSVDASASSPTAATEAFTAKKCVKNLISAKKKFGVTTRRNLKSRKLPAPIANVQYKSVVDKLTCAKLDLVKLQIKCLEEETIEKRKVWSYNEHERKKEAEFKENERQKEAEFKENERQKEAEFNEKERKWKEEEYNIKLNYLK